ncbi:MAG: helix-turn-helix domain-containing protein, partial [Phycicoccus sp.]
AEDLGPDRPRTRSWPSGGYTTADQARALGLVLEEGLGYSEVGRRLGISWHTIRNWAIDDAARRGEPLPDHLQGSRKLTDQQRREVLDRLAAGHSRKAVAEATGVSAGSVSTIVKEHRGAGQAPSGNAVGPPESNSSNEVVIELSPEGEFTGPVDGDPGDGPAMPPAVDLDRVALRQEATSRFLRVRM